MRTAIIGVGNPLMGDDGAGVRALDLLRKRALPGVELVELGTGGMSLLHVLEKFDTAIIIDAVDFGGEPGEVRGFTPDQVVSIKTLGYSLHDIDILKVIELARNMGTCPGRLVIVAVQPAVLEPSMTLSPAVEGSLAELVETAVRLVNEMSGEDGK